MDIAALISSYGYLAVLVGAFFEGEAVVMLAGAAAHLGYLHLPWVIAAAFMGTLLGDQFYFYLGRRHGTAWLERRPRWRARADQVTRRLDRHPTLFILSYRFVYGMRTVALVTIGLSRVPALRFLALNAISAGVWAVLVAGAGYAFGQATRLLLQDLERYEGWIVAAVVLLVALALAILRSRGRRRNGAGSGSGE